ncbi:methionine ABC transporter permease [Commensalibacter nepenthis]|uniref:Methionine ABC transporter permease n=1 Tax=Commensalibacter nepenthis TaxID=3043872 RepID=A0ABT6Q5Q8_9PROT|nr:methionine ABC transporter permease [Commensalibacter sp. TBRC 10068]MDI2112236.1 methionine ABC transporter permease [Commensalibacter sp. TBRC 10068]
MLHSSLDQINAFIANTLNLSPYLLKQLYQAIADTAEMTAACSFLTLIGGLPIALFLVITAPGGLRPAPFLNRIVSIIINIFRSIPFIILLVALIPVTRFIIGTSIGTEAAIIPLSIATIPYFTRIAEVSLKEVDQGLIEAVKAMGGSRLTIIREVLLPEALPGLIAGFTVTIILVIGISAMAGTIGAGGLGRYAIKYGYQDYRNDITLIVTVLLVIIISAIQWVGDYLARKVNHR